MTPPAMHPMQQGTHDPEPLNLRQREVLALERIADVLERFLEQFRRREG